VIVTIKDHPRPLYPEIMERWYGTAHLEARLRERYPLPKPDHPAASREGQTNPDEDTTRWEWDKDLSKKESDAFDAIVEDVKLKRTRGY
jgi:hypothetical protein